MVTDGTHRVTGELTPDATGTYEDAGEFNGKHYYNRNSDWYIWWDEDAGNWYISTTPGTPGEGYWTRNDPNIEGIYTPTLPVTGEATVTEI